MDHPDYERLIQRPMKLWSYRQRQVETVLNSVKPVFRCAEDAEVIMKLTDADNAAIGIFFPARAKYDGRGVN